MRFLILIFELVEGVGWGPTRFGIGRSSSEMFFVTEGAVTVIGPDKFGFKGD